MSTLSVADQTTYFLCSIVLGLILGALYDLLRAVRMLVRARGVSVAVTDVVFFTVCGVITSLFALPFNKGDVRAFIIFGEAVGFLAYRLTLGSVMGKFYSHLARFLRTFLQKIYKISEKIFDLLLKVISILVYNIHEVVDKSLNKSASVIKKHHSADKAHKASRGHNKGRYNEQNGKNAKARKERKDRGQRKKQNRR